MTKRFVHDCDKCLFLGQYKEKDWYYCSEQALDGSVIGRFGNDGPDYASIPLKLLKSYTGVDSTFIMDATHIMNEKKL